MEVTLLPLVTNEVILISTTLPTEGEPTWVKVVDYLTAKYVAPKDIMLTATTNVTFEPVLLTFLKLSTCLILLLDLRIFIGFWTLGLQPI